MLVGWTETLRDDCLNSVSDYFAGKKDNSVVSFGRVGRNVITRLSSRAVMGTELITVEGNGRGPGVSLVSYLGKKLIYGFRDELDHMEYVRSLSSSTMNGRVALDIVSGEQRIGKINVDEKEFNNRPEDTSARVLSSTSSTSSFILLSNFGECLAQRMHIAFSKLLTQKGIPHLNIVAMPGNLESANLDMAYTGIDELKGNGGKVITYTDEYREDADDELSPEFYQKVAKKVNEFSMKLAAKANLLKMQVLIS